MYAIQQIEPWNPRTSSSDWADVLASFPLFSGIAKRRLRSLVEESTVAEYAPGGVVVDKGDPGNALYVILSGSARVRGRPASRTLRTGDYFGELGAVDGSPRSAAVVAREELHVMRLPRQSFLKLAKRYPAISLRMLSALGSQIRRLEAQPAAR